MARPTKRTSQIIEPQYLLKINCLYAFLCQSKQHAHTHLNFKQINPIAYSASCTDIYLIIYIAWRSISISEKGAGRLSICQTLIDIFL